jgi:CheY-like chemotaxis protein
VQTILVIDDELGAIEVLVAALEDEGYRVLSAGNGRHGLESLAATSVDLVIVDFMMPLLDGAAMGRAMKEQPSLRDIPIIMMSAVSESLVRKQFSGYTAFLRKPFRVSALIDLVHKVLGRPPPASGSPAGPPSTPPSTAPPSGQDPGA